MHAQVLIIGSGTGRLYGQHLCGTGRIGNRFVDGAYGRRSIDVDT